jgi:hypothetical protein
MKKHISDFCMSSFGKCANPKMLTVIFILAMGIFLRMWQYAANRSLWLDEASLALNLINRSFIGLLQPLDYNQAAPLGFLFIQKISVLVLGNSEYSLRLFPLIAGTFSLLLMYHIAIKYLQGTAVYTVLALFSISSFLIYYSSENKQYASDVLFTLILLTSGYSCLDSNTKPRSYALLAGSGIIAIWMSHPALFVMAGIGLALMVQQISRKDRQRLLWSGITILLWLANFAFLYLISLRFASLNNYLINFWSFSFMPMPPWSNMKWFAATLKSVLINPLGLTFVSLSTFLLFAGLISIFLRRWDLGLVVSLPIFTALIVSGFQKYPFTDRLLLFLVPLFFILIAEGLERIRGILDKYSHLVGYCTCWVLLILLLFNPVAIALTQLEEPDMSEHIRPVIEYLSHKRQNSDAVYLHRSSRSAFMYYSHLSVLKDNEYRLGTSSRSEPEKYWKDIDKLRGNPRVWFIFSHSSNKAKVNEEMYYLIYLNKIGRKIDEFKAPGAAAYLYDLRDVQRQLR